MARNLYVRPNDLKVDLQIDTSATPTIAVLERLIEQVSRHVDKALSRRFYSETATVLFDGNGQTSLRLADYATEPWRSDLISVTTLKVDTTGDGTFDTTLTADSDYWLDPRNASSIYRPVQKILIPQDRTTSPQISVWPNAPRRIEIAGKWGYSEETEDTGDDVEDDPLSSSATSITVNDEDNFEVGDTLLIESEQVYVSGVSSDSSHTLTVARGVNGTTGASHVQNTDISRIRYPIDVVGAVEDETVRMYRERATGHAGTLVPLEAGNFRGMYARIREALDQYRRVVGFV